METGSPFRAIATAMTRSTFSKSTVAISTSAAIPASTGEIPSQFSWGYEVLKSSPDTVGGRPVRRLKAIRLLEVSPVLRGASIGTQSTSVKCEACAAKGDGSNGDCSDEAAELRRAYDELEDLEAKVEGARLRNEFLTLAATRFVETSTVPAAKRAAAEQAVASAAADLGIPVPAVKFFEEGARHEVAPAFRKYLQPGTVLMGSASPDTNTVWLSPKLSLFEIRQTGPHEVHHLAKGRDETQAELFGIAASLKESRMRKPPENKNGHGHAVNLDALNPRTRALYERTGHFGPWTNQEFQSVVGFIEPTKSFEPPMPPEVLEAMEAEDLCTIGYDTANREWEAAVAAVYRLGGLPEGGSALPSASHTVGPDPSFAERRRRGKAQADERKSWVTRGEAGERLVKARIASRAEQVAWRQDLLRVSEG